jgi:hypothetical protein
VLLLHGFQMVPEGYQSLADALASHGFIVVAPDMPKSFFNPISTTEEAELAQAVLDWMPAHLGDAAGVTAVTSTIGIAGHSRGGKVAYRILDANPTAADALFGIDPVDTTGNNTDTRVIDGAFTFSIPSLLMGTGLGSVDPPGLFTGVCAPVGDNYETFYDATPAPSTRVLVPDYGHMDMLEPGCAGAVGCSACAANDDPAPMITQTAGLLVGFFRETLDGDAGALEEALDHAPVTITVESK